MQKVSAHLTNTILHVLLMSGASKKKKKQENVDLFKNCSQITLLISPVCQMQSK